MYAGLNIFMWKEMRIIVFVKIYIYKFTPSLLARINFFYVERPLESILQCFVCQYYFILTLAFLPACLFTTIVQLLRYGPDHKVARVSIGKAVCRDKRKKRRPGPLLSFETLLNTTNISHRFTPNLFSPCLSAYPFRRANHSCQYLSIVTIIHSFLSFLHC